MLTQIYSIYTPDEACAISAIGVDHIGSVVGFGERARELSTDAAQRIGAAVQPPSKFSALYLGNDISRIATSARSLSAAIVHLAAPPDMLSPADLGRLKAHLPDRILMRSIPVTGEESLAIAKSYDQIADMLLLDSVRSADGKFGAVGLTHDWTISRRIVDSVRIPVILAGGLGVDNLAEAIRFVRPAGVDSKTKTDRSGSSVKDLELVRQFHEIARAAV